MPIPPDSFFALAQEFPWAFFLSSKTSVQYRRCSLLSSVLPTFSTAVVFQLGFRESKAFQRFETDPLRTQGDAAPVSFPFPQSPLPTSRQFSLSQCTCPSR